MSMLDSIKDPNTGKIKTPILISLIGAGGLVAYLFISGKGTSQAGGVSGAPLDTGAGGGGLPPTGGDSGSGAPPNPEPLPIPNQPPTPTPLPNQSDQSYSPQISSYQQPYSPQIPGSSGSGGGGGSGTGLVIQPIAKDPTVYGGLAVAPITIPNVIKTIAVAPSPTVSKVTTGTLMPSGSTPSSKTAPRIYEPAVSKTVAAVVPKTTTTTPTTSTVRATVSKAI